MLWWCRPILEEPGQLADVGFLLQDVLLLAERSDDLAVIACAPHRALQRRSLLSDWGCGAASHTGTDDQPG
jgi:hypothetical protein